MLQLGKGFLHRRAHADKPLAPARTGFGDAEYLLLGGFQQLLARAAFRHEGVTRNFRAGIDQLPQHRLLAHDVGISSDIGGRWRGIREFEDVARATDEFSDTLCLEPFTERHRIGRHRLIRQFADGTKDQGVVAPVEVAFIDAIGDLVPGFRWGLGMERRGRVRLVRPRLS